MVYGFVLVQDGTVHRSLHLSVYVRTFEGLVESDGVIARRHEHRRHAQARHRSTACLDDGFHSFCESETVSVLMLRTGGSFLKRETRSFSLRC